MINLVLQVLQLFKFNHWKIKRLNLVIPKKIVVVSVVLLFIKMTIKKFEI